MGHAINLCPASANTVDLGLHCLALSLVYLYQQPGSHHMIG